MMGSGLDKEISGPQLHHRFYNSNWLWCDLICDSKIFQELPGKMWKMNSVVAGVLIPQARN